MRSWALNEPSNGKKRTSDVCFELYKYGHFG
ncbi:MAG: hypothetical protein EWM73_03114 [Nitrospira sp.]|nr:MAG: hypothetical protein EWM73_03114 [Nitrospira sp.]